MANNELLLVLSGILSKKTAEINKFFEMPIKAIEMDLDSAKEWLEQSLKKEIARACKEFQVQGDNIEVNWGRNGECSYRGYFRAVVDKNPATKDFYRERASIIAAWQERLAAAENHYREIKKDLIMYGRTKGVIEAIEAFDSKSF